MIVIGYEHPTRLRGSTKTYWYLAASRAQHRLSVLHSAPSCVCIYKVPREISEKDIREEYSKYGKIMELRLADDNKDKSKRSAYITFERSGNAAKAAILGSKLSYRGAKSQAPRVVNQRSYPRHNCVGVPLPGGTPTKSELFNQYKTHGQIVKINWKDGVGYFTFKEEKEAEHAAASISRAFQLGKK